MNNVVNDGQINAFDAWATAENVKDTVRNILLQRIN